MDFKAARGLLEKKRFELGGGKISLVKRDVTVRAEDQYGKQVEDQVEVHRAENNAKILQAIDNAIGRCVLGTYGRCMECGEEISSARIQAVPWTSKCITCKQQEGERSTVGRPLAERFPPPLNRRH